MPIGNPGSEANQNQPVLTQELIDKLEANPEGLTQLTEAQLRALVEDDGEVVVEKPIEKAAPVVTPGASTTPSPKVEEKAPVAAPQEGEEYRRVSNELNTSKQSLESTKAQLAEAKKLLEANQKAKEGQGGKTKISLDDENLFEKLVDTIGRLESRVEALTTENETVLKSKVGELETSTSKTETDRTFLQIEQFQMRSKELGMDLRTKRPIREIDNDVSKLDRLIGAENVKKMKTDKAFRTQMEAQGVKLPEGWETHDVIMNLHQLKVAEGYPTYTGAFADFSEKSDYLKKRVQDVALESADAISQQVIKNSKEASVLPSSSGNGADSHTIDGAQWTKEKAFKWMDANREPKTAADRKIQYQIMEWLETQPDE